MLDTTETARAIAKLDDRIAKTKVKVEELLAERLVQEKLLIEAYQAGEVQRIRVAGRTVYLQRQLWAQYENKKAACAALEEAGLGEFVEPGFNTQTVSAHLRTLPQDDQDQPIMPPEFKGRLGVREVFSIRTRKAS